MFLCSVFRHLSCVPKKGDPKKGTPAKILYGLLGRPRYISETRPADSDSPKCLTLGLGHTPEFSQGIASGVSGRNASLSKNNNVPDELILSG